MTSGAEMTRMNILTSWRVREWLCIWN